MKGANGAYSGEKCLLRFTSLFHIENSGKAQWQQDGRNERRKIVSTWAKQSRISCSELLQGRGRPDEFTGCTADINQWNILTGLVENVDDGGFKS